MLSHSFTSASHDFKQLSSAEGIFCYCQSIYYYTCHNWVEL